MAAAADADTAPPAEEDAAPLDTRARFAAGHPPSPLAPTSVAAAAVAPSSSAAGTGTSNVTMNAGYLSSGYE